MSKIIILLTLVNIVLGLTIFTLNNKREALQDTGILSYQSIFDNTPIQTLPQTTKLLFLGDIMLGRSINLGILKRQDVEWPLRGLYPVTHSVDFALANLESPLIKSCPTSDSGFKFCGDAASVNALVQANIKVVTIANNHIANYGESGLQETIQVLNDAGIKVVGTNNDPVVVRHNGNNLAFFGANDIGATPSVINTVDEAFLNKIRQSRGRGELVIIGVHWGSEYTSTPSTRQLGLEQQLKLAGATIIAGHHPHWVQPVLQDDSTLTLYSLGNTVFDQEWSQETKRGLLVEVNIHQNSIVNTQEHRVLIQNYGEAILQ